MEPPSQTSSTHSGPHARRSAFTRGVRVCRLPASHSIGVSGCACHLCCGSSTCVCMVRCGVALKPTEVSHPGADVVGPRDCGSCGVPSSLTDGGGQSVGAAILTPPHGHAELSQASQNCASHRHQTQLAQAPESRWRAVLEHCVVRVYECLLAQSRTHIGSMFCVVSRRH